MHEVRARCLWFLRPDDLPATDEERVWVLSFDGAPPDAADLSRRWHALLERARRIVDLLPPEQVRRCVLVAEDRWCAAEPAELEALIEGRRLLFHEGRIRGAFPSPRSGSTGA